MNAKQRVEHLVLRIRGLDPNELEREWRQMDEAKARREKAEAEAEARARRIEEKYLEEAARSFGQRGQH